MVARAGRVARGAGPARAAAVAELVVELAARVQQAEPLQQLRRPEPGARVKPVLEKR